MKLVILSDNHAEYNFDVPDGDILIHAGDFSFTGSFTEICDFIELMNKQPHKYKLWIPGNHEIGLQNHSHTIEVIDKETEALCIHNKEHEIDGIKFFGSAFTPEVRNWAFMYNKEQAKKYWENAPDEVDVLITHGPPYGYLDMSDEGENLGCKSLLKYIEKIQPKVHAWGHIHEAYGTWFVAWENTKKTTHMFNASVVNRKYYMSNKSTVVEINKKGIIK